MSDSDKKEKYNRIDLWKQRNQKLTTTSLELLPTSPSSIQEESKAIYTFGLLTDIQYAPVPDGFSYGGNPRYYQHAKVAAEHAAKHFEEEKVSCVINLGDIVDGKCSDVDGYHLGHESVDDVLNALSSYTTGKILHTYGNHELYNLSR